MTMLSAQKTYTTYRFPTEIRFGVGVYEDVPAVLQELEIRRPFLVTDQEEGQSSWYEELYQKMAEQGPMASFTEMAGNPAESHVEAGVVAFRKHRADGIVALGGGAAIDVAKAIALMSGHPGRIFEYEDGHPEQRSLSQELPPIIAIPTTAGTGSEVGCSSIITDEVSRKKRIITLDAMLPRVVLADPELALDLPPQLTATTGIDALSHCIEAFLAHMTHPICEGVALEGIHFVAKSLKVCARGEGDRASLLQGRSDMLHASLMGSIASQKGLGVTHSCAHALSEVFDIHHGLAVSLVLIPCMEFNYEVCQPHFARMAQAAGCSKTQGKAFLHWLHRLLDELSIPSSLLEMGVAKELLPQLVTHAFEDHCHSDNPRPVAREDFENLFLRAMKTRSSS